VPELTASGLGSIQDTDETGLTTTNQEYIVSATVIDRELTALHASYVEAVNSAIGQDDLARAQALASCFDAESLDVFVRHGYIVPLPVTLRPSPRPVRRLVQRLTGSRTAA